MDAHEAWQRLREALEGTGDPYAQCAPYSEPPDHEHVWAVALTQTGPWAQSEEFHCYRCPMHASLPRN